MKTTVIIRPDKGDPVCPECNSRNDAAASPHDAPPKIGDVAVCFHCGELLEYTEDFSLIRMPPESWDELSEEDQQAVRRASQELKAKRPN
jgi:hypothetical protein